MNNNLTSENEKLIGVYQIRNLLNNKSYVGSTFLSFRKRYNLHIHQLRKNKHHSNYLQNSYNKYKESSFIFEILEVCKKEELIEKEQMYINKAINRYNMSPTAGRPFGIKLTQETKDKMSLAKKGRKLSEETKNKIRKFNLNKEVSEETKRKMSTSQIKPIIQYSLNSEFIKEWSSQDEATLSLGLTRGRLSNNIRGKAKTAAGYIWKLKLKNGDR